MTGSDEDIADAVEQLGSEHASDVASAIETLVSNPRTAEPALVAALTTPRAVHAAELLGRLGSDASVAPLADAARRGGEGLRWHAIAALGAMQSAHAVDALAELAAGHDPDIRRAVAWALAERPERAAHRVLIELASDVDAGVRDAADRAGAGVAQPDRGTDA